MMLHDEFEINCKRQKLLKIKGQVCMLEGCMLDDCVFVIWLDMTTSH